MNSLTTNKIKAMVSFHAFSGAVFGNIVLIVLYFFVVGAVAFSTVSHTSGS